MSVVPLPCWTSPPITKNEVRRQHHHAEAKARAKAMTECRWAIKAARLTPVDRATVILNWSMPDKRRRDGDGASPTLAVCLDALVAEGVLPDDSWRYVAHSGVTCHPPVPGQPGALWLTVTAIGDAA